jgi:acid stress chaperone HdeA
MTGGDRHDGGRHREAVAVIVGECKKTPKDSFKTKVRELHKRSGQITLFEHH